MTQTTRERLCRAACLAAGLDPDRKYKSSSDHPANAPWEFAWQEYGEEVDAILAELREPDDATVDAGTDTLAFADGHSTAYQSRSAFTAMIDHVRKS